MLVHHLVVHELLSCVESPKDYIEAVKAFLPLCPTLESTELNACRQHYLRFLRLVFSSGNGKIMIRGVDENVPKTFSPSSGYVCVCSSPDGRYVASGNQHGNLTVWDTITKTEFSLPGEISFAALCFSHDSLYLASAEHGDIVIKIWDICNRIHSCTIPMDDPYQINCMCYSPDGLYLAAAGDKSIQIWNTQDKKSCERKTLELGYIVLTIAFSPDGNFLAAGCYNGSLIIWNIEQKIVLQVLEAHSNYIKTVRYSRDGRYLTSVGNNSIVTWNVKKKNGSIKEKKGQDKVWITGVMCFFSR